MIRLFIDDIQNAREALITICEDLQFDSRETIKVTDNSYSIFIDWNNNQNQIKAWLLDKENKIVLEKKGNEQETDTVINDFLYEIEYSLDWQKA